MRSSNAAKLVLVTPGSYMDRCVISIGSRANSSLEASPAEPAKISHESCKVLPPTGARMWGKRTDPE
jgi:hypothetical protein